MRWKPFRYDGVLYDLSHLHPKTVVFNQPASGKKPERAYTVNVGFGLHCFTRGTGLYERIDPELIYEDSREWRIFDCCRYELSKQLPAIVDGLPRRKCYHTERGNFFTVEAVNDAGRLVEYSVFFDASRSSVRGCINLFVQSAYTRDIRHGSYKKPIGFLIILYNTLNKRAIKPASI
jgi:hypothetical protein